MKKKYILIVLLLGIASAGFYISLIPKTYTKEIKVPFTLQKTGEQLYMLPNLVKWYLPFAGDEAAKQMAAAKKTGEVTAGNHTLTILSPSSLSCVAAAGYEGNKKEFLFSAIPDSAEIDACLVRLTYKSTLLNRWLDKSSLIKTAENSLENLKVFMEDTRLFYGYAIEQTTVTDTSFIFLSAAVPAIEKDATNKLFEQLMRYSEEKNAGYTGTRIFYSLPYGNGKVMLFASIGVSKNVDIPPGETIQYKRMPFGKSLLMATYQGPYKDISKVYTALEEFKADHKFSSMAIPYQKFMNDGYDFAEDQMVQMKVYYPIF